MTATQFESLTVTQPPLLSLSLSLLDFSRVSF